MGCCQIVLMPPILSALRSVQVGEMLLDGQSLKFYQYDGEVQELLDDVRRKINELSESWTPEQKAHCLEETEQSFKYSGMVMQRITADQ